MGSFTSTWRKSFGSCRSDHRSNSCFGKCQSKNVPTLSVSIFYSLEGKIIGANNIVVFQVIEKRKWGLKGSGELNRAVVWKRKGHTKDQSVFNECLRERWKYENSYHPPLTDVQRNWSTRTITFDASFMRWPWNDNEPKSLNCRLRIKKRRGSFYILAKNTRCHKFLRLLYRNLSTRSSVPSILALPFLLFRFFFLFFCSFLVTKVRKFCFAAQESTTTKFAARTWWITPWWSLDTRQPNGFWRTGGVTDGVKMDICVWLKTKIDAA